MIIIKQLCVVRGDFLLAALSVPHDPEYNKQFSDQSSTMPSRLDQTGNTNAGTGTSSTGQCLNYTVGSNTYCYANWNNAEPNNSGGNENALQIVSGGSGNWNDLPENSSTMGYIVEYGGNNEVLLYPLAQRTVNVTIAAFVPGFSATTPTFPNTSQGKTSVAQTVTVTNNGHANLVFGAGAVTLTGTNSSDFAITNDGCSGQTVSPSSTCTVSLSFSPSAIGTRSGVLNFADNVAGSPQTVSMSATGAVFDNSAQIAAAAQASAAAQVKQDNDNANILGALALAIGTIEKGLGYVVRASKGVINKSKKSPTPAKASPSRVVAPQISPKASSPSKGIISSPTPKPLTKKSSP
jgi:hypothetical protein